MSERLLVELAKRKARVFENLAYHLTVIKETVKELDTNAEIYLFGSLVTGEFTLSSDIDILVVTDKPPETVLVKLWEKGIKDPFEIHVVGRENLDIYKRRSKLVAVEEFTSSTKTHLKT